jgi:hypothetical protein
MIRHQAIGINPAAQLLFPFPQIVKVIQIVVVGNKDNLPVVPSLYYVVWVSAYDNTGFSGHGTFIITATSISKNK